MNLNPTNGANKPLVPSSKLYLLIFMKGPYSLEASNNFSGITKKAPNISIQKEKEDNPEQTVVILEISIPILFHLSQNILNY